MAGTVIDLNKMNCNANSPYDLGVYPSYHGGRCCGIVHISGFSNGDVSETVGAYTPDDANRAVWLGRGARGEHVWSGTNCMNETRPKETYLERFKAIVAYFKKEHHGLLEVVLIDERPCKMCTTCDEDEKCKSQSEIWEEHVLAEGFEKGPRFENSNSYNHLQVYYLVY